MDDDELLDALRARPDADDPVIAAANDHIDAHLTVRHSMALEGQQLPGVMYASQHLLRLTLGLARSHWSPRQIVAWLTTPRDDLAGLSPVDALDDEYLPDLVHAAAARTAAHHHLPGDPTVDATGVEDRWRALTMEQRIAVLDWVADRPPDAAGRVVVTDDDINQVGVRP